MALGALFRIPTVSNEVAHPLKVPLHNRLEKSLKNSRKINDNLSTNIINKL